MAGTVGCHGMLYGCLLVQFCRSPNQRLQSVYPPETCERRLSAIWLKRLNPNLIVSKDIHPYFPVVTLPTPISSVIPSNPVEPSHFNGLVLHAQVLAGKVGFPAGWNYCPPRRAPSVLRRVCSGMAGVLDLMIEINYYGILSIRSPWHTMHR